jgi:hypothetical protein
MKKIHADNTYDFYIGHISATIEHGTILLYNIVPKNSLAPKGGYENMAFIENIKHVKFPERYQKDVPHRYK